MLIKLTSINTGTKDTNNVWINPMHIESMCETVDTLGTPYTILETATQSIYTVIETADGIIAKINIMQR